MSLFQNTGKKLFSEKFVYFCIFPLFKTTSFTEIPTVLGLTFYHLGTCGLFITHSTALGLPNFMSNLLNTPPAITLATTMVFSGGGANALPVVGVGCNGCTSLRQALADYNAQYCVPIT